MKDISLDTLFTLRISLSLLFAATGFCGWSQDLHFSQFGHASVLLSPTETGNYHGDWRFINNVRNQWGQIGKPLNTVALAYDRQVYLFSQKLSIGGQFVYDESGNYRIIHQKFLLSLAYHQTLGFNTFRVGVQGGLVQKRLNNMGFVFPDQWDQSSGSFSNDVATNELFLQRNIKYPDFNVGGAFSRRIWKFTPELSFALFHINRPSESFFSQENHLRIRKVVYLDIPYEINPKWSLEPQLLYMWQNKTIDFIVGSYANYRLQPNFTRAKYVFGGVSLRNAMTRNWDAFIFTTGLQFKHLRTAISYDVTVSKLRLANSYQGAVEFALIYTGLSSVLSKRAIPCNRL